MSVTILTQPSHLLWTISRECTCPEITSIVFFNCWIFHIVSLKPFLGSPIYCNHINLMWDSRAVGRRLEKKVWENMKGFRQNVLGYFVTHLLRSLVGGNTTLNTWQTSVKPRWSHQSVCCFYRSNAVKVLKDNATKSLEYY